MTTHLPPAFAPTLLLWAGLCLAPASLAREAAEAGTPFEAAAQCVAVLKQELQARLHAHPTAQENDAWQRQAESAFAHAGGGYQAGFSQEQAQQLLDSAQQRVAGWPAAQLQQQAVQCLGEGDRLLDRAAPLEKVLVRNAARRWLARQLRRLPA